MSAPGLRRLALPAPIDGTSAGPRPAGASRRGRPTPKPDPNDEPSIPRHTEDWSVCRETFLAHFEPDERDRLRAAGDVLFARILSGDPPHETEPWTHARLRALALDLRFAAQLLAELTDEADHSDPADPDEHRLLAYTSTWSRQVHHLAEQVEKAVNAWPGTN